MNAKHIFLDQEKISQKQISIIDFITQILPNKMSRPEVDRPICLLDNRNRYTIYVCSTRARGRIFLLGLFFLNWLPLLLTKLTKSWSYMALSNESPVTSVVPKYLGILDVVLQMEFATKFY